MVKIWKWIKLPFINKTLLNHVYIRIWSSWLTFTFLQWRKTNFKIIKFSRFLLRSEYAIQVKIWKWLKLLNSLPFIKETIVNHVTFDHFDWFSQFFSEWRQTSKLVNFKDFSKVCDFGQNLKMIKTSQFCGIHQENSCKSCLHWNLIILNDIHSFTVNEDKLQN